MAVHLDLKWSLGRSSCTGECAGMSLWTGAGRCLLSTFAFMWEQGCRASSSLTLPEEPLMWAQLERLLPFLFYVLSVTKCNLVFSFLCCDSPSPSGIKPPFFI